MLLPTAHNRLRCRCLHHVEEGTQQKCHGSDLAYLLQVASHQNMRTSAYNSRSTLIPTREDTGGGVPTPPYKKGRDALPISFLELKTKCMSHLVSPYIPTTCKRLRLLPRWQRRHSVRHMGSPGILCASRYNLGKGHSDNFARCILEHLPSATFEHHFESSHPPKRLALRLYGGSHSLIALH